MSELVNELKNEHAVLVDVLGKVKALGIDKAEAQKLLMSAKGALIDHLTKEDQKLYPVLRKAAEKDSVLAATLNTFAKDMEAITETALAFFGKYERGGSDTEFSRDFASIHSALWNRIRKEESILYEAYNRAAV